MSDWLINTWFTDVAIAAIFGTMSVVHNFFIRINNNVLYHLDDFQTQLYLTLTKISSSCLHQVI